MVPSIKEVFATCLSSNALQVPKHRGVAQTAVLDFGLGHWPICAERRATVVQLSMLKVAHAIVSTCAPTCGCIILRVLTPAGAADGPTHHCAGRPGVHRCTGGADQRQGRRPPDRVEDLLPLQGAPTAHQRGKLGACLLHSTPGGSQPLLYGQLPGCQASAMGCSHLVQVRCLGGCRRTVDAAPGGVPPPLCSFCAEEEGKAAEVQLNPK